MIKKGWGTRTSGGSGILLGGIICFGMQYYPTETMSILEFFGPSGIGFFILSYLGLENYYQRAVDFVDPSSPKTEKDKSRITETPPDFETLIDEMESEDEET